MPDCCDPAPYSRFFDGKEAERRLKRYRRRGLDRMASTLLAYLRGRDLRGRQVLEIGGGIGDFQVELLKAGADRSVNVELSGEYEETARRLLDAERITDRVERRLGDFVEEQETLGSADLVVLNRVICCYPWMERMMSAAASKTRWLLAIAVPRDRAVSRIMVRVSNAVLKLTGQQFESFVHPVDRMVEIASEAGLSRVFVDNGVVWQGMVFERR